MRRIVIILCSFLSLIDAEPLKGQNISFYQLGVEEGLQNNIVYSISQDDKGFMWAGTMTGIDRYDGNEFVHYKIPDFYRKRLEFSTVQFIVKSLKGRIWASSSNNLLLYDPAQDAFVNLPEFQKAFDRNQNIIGLSIDANENVWVGSNNGITLFNPVSKQTSKFKKANFQARIFFPTNGRKVLVGSNWGISTFGLVDNKIKEFPTTDKRLTGFKSLNVSHISLDKQNRYWIGTIDQGLFVTSPDAYGQLNKVNLNPTLGRPFTIKDVIHHDKKQEHLIALDGGGLFILGNDLKTVNHFQTNEDNPKSLSNNGIYDIFIDNYERVWLATYGNGINYYATQTQPFLNFKHELNNANSLSNNMAKCATEDQEGNLWFGTRKGLSKLNRKTNQWSQYNNETKGKLFSSDNVLSVISHLGALWVGTYGGGLIKISTQDGTIKNYRNDPRDPNSIGTDYVYAVFNDSRNLIWCGGIRGPLSVLNTSTGKFTRLSISATNVNGQLFHVD